MQYAVPRAKVYLLFLPHSSKETFMLPLVPGYLLEKRRKELVMVLQLPPFLDSFHHQFSARIVVQFERGKRLPLNEHYVAF